VEYIGLVQIKEISYHSVGVDAVDRRIQYRQEMADIAERLQESKKKEQNKPISFFVDRAIFTIRAGLEREEETMVVHHTPIERTEGHGNFLRLLVD
jgi:hypothetical protein